MPEQKPLSREMLAVLHYLWDEATLGSGWLRRGVRGWRMYREIRHATKEYLLDTLPYMAKRGLLDRVDVLEPGRERTVQLYRISTQGAQAVGETGRRKPHRVPPPEREDASEGTFYVPVSPWSVLRTLRMYAAERAGPLRFGEHGWMTLGEVRRADPGIRGDDLKWLLTRRLIERRETHEQESPERRTILYRATEQGQRAEPVEAVQSPGGIEYVAVRVRERAGPEPRQEQGSAPAFGSRSGCLSGGD